MYTSELGLLFIDRVTLASMLASTKKKCSFDFLRVMSFNSVLVVTYFMCIEVTTVVWGYDCCLGEGRKKYTVAKKKWWWSRRRWTPDPDRNCLRCIYLCVGCFLLCFLERFLIWINNRAVL